eukprot:6214431-Pleurochrysis_carterae.AAC.4
MSGVTPRGKAQESERQKNLAEGYTGDEKWERGGREKTEELDGAGGMYARGPMATVNAHRHVLRHAVNCRFSARGNLHRDLDLTAGRPAILARAQSYGS